MEPRDHIELTIQLPVEELGRLTQLVEQVRQLMDGTSPSGTAGNNENETSGSFDNTRFQELALHQSQDQNQTELAMIPPVQPEPVDIAALPERTSTRENHPTVPAQAEEPLHQDNSSANTNGDENGTVPELPAEEQPAPPQQELHDMPELTVSAASYSPQSQLPDAPGGSWGSVQEELSFSGPAPLTAEAVSRAFQQDDRRYDNGFPLY